MSWMAEINRVATKCFKAGLSATKTLVLVQEACGNEALNRSNFLSGIHHFVTEGSWWITREVAVQNQLELRKTLLLLLPIY
jgi:hypothetical protein